MKGSAHILIIFVMAVSYLLLSSKNLLRSFYSFDAATVAVRSDTVKSSWTPIVEAPSNDSNDSKERKDDRTEAEAGAGETNPAITLALIRSIGNALPPRHSSNQTLDNLRFTLLYEKPFPNVIKHWLINRIVDKIVQEQVLELLDYYNHTYTIIPFDLKEYSKLSLNFQLYQPSPDYVHSRPPTKQHNKLFPQAIEIQKNLYVCNVNGARNTMMDVGVNTLNATWVLPWDGNCFIPDDALQHIYDQLSNTTTKYAMTPTHRVVGDNQHILDPTYQRAPSEEPMLSFRHDALGRFHPMLWYGRRDKVELLFRMGLHGSWDKYANFTDWEFKALTPPLKAPLTDVEGGVSQVGWAYRLNSGNPHLEVLGKGANRMVARNEGVTGLFRQLDEWALYKVHNFSSDALLFYNESELLLDQQSKDPKVLSQMAQLVATANHSLTLGPWSIMEKYPSCANSSDCHDYHSPHHEPLVNSSNHDAHNVSDKTRLVMMQYHTTVLALAFKMTGVMEYATHAAHSLRIWFVNETTRMNPHLNQEMNMDSSEHGIIELKDMYYVLDAIRMLRSSGALSNNEFSVLNDWFKSYLNWLETSTQGMTDYTAADFRGVYYDIQIISLAAFVNDTDKMLWYLDRSMSRLMTHVNSDGKIPRAYNRKEQCELAQLVSLQGWVSLAQLGLKVGRNLWEALPILVDGKEMSALCRAAHFTIPYYHQRNECPGNAVTVNSTRWWPLWYETQRHCPEPTRSARDTTDKSEFLAAFEMTPPESAYDMPSTFSVDDGIAPFWNFGR